MLNKLAFRNARRSMRDYLIYLVTMTIISALMLAFNSLIFSRDLKALYAQGGGIMAAMLWIGSLLPMGARRIDRAGR